jgi:hypothetical protein
MTRNPVKTVSIAADRAQPQLSKGQQAFNKLIQQIEKKRALLVAWETAVPSYQQKYVSELMPLLKKTEALQIERVYYLDRASERKILSQADSRKLTTLIIGMANALLAENDDAALKAIYNKHSQSDYDSEEAASLQDMKSALEGMLNINLGDDQEVHSEEDLISRAQAHLQEKETQQAAQRQARAERRSQRKKSAKQLAQEEKQQAEAQQISQSIREVYRKLASALHPDRESDPQERERKTALMQRVNQAYEKNNLLQLLELQLELEHIDQSAINNLSEDRLKHYNKVLKEQLAELELEIEHVRGRFRAQFGIPPFVTLSPAALIDDLARDIVGTEQSVALLEKELLALEDVKHLKAWIKEIHRQTKADAFYASSF